MFTPSNLEKEINQNWLEIIQYDNPLFVQIGVGTCKCEHISRSHLKNLPKMTENYEDDLVKQPSTLCTLVWLYKIVASCKNWTTIKTLSSHFKSLNKIN